MVLWESRITKRSPLSVTMVQEAMGQEFSKMAIENLWGGTEGMPPLSSKGPGTAEPWREIRNLFL